MEASSSHFRSFADVMRAKQSHTTGFDYLRIGLSLAILAEHVFDISIHGFIDTVPASWFGSFNRMELGIFFALSGFLVAGSLTRNNMPRFLALRLLRIIPALAVEVVMTALIVGVCFTTLPLSDYFHSPVFFGYFLNIIGDIHFILPGVFGEVAVNSQLWTIPIEFKCYFVLVLISIVGLKTNKDIFMILVCATSLSLTILALQNNSVNMGPVMPSWGLVLSFLYGVLGYLFKEKIPHNGYLALTSMASAYAILNAPNLVFLAPIPIAYLTVYVGLLRLPKIPFGDLSYGVYLFHYPLLRTIYHLTQGQAPVAALLGLVLASTAVFASLSWFWIEKPIVDSKDKWLAWVDNAMVWISRPARQILRLYNLTDMTTLLSRVRAK